MRKLHVQTSTPLTHRVKKRCFGMFRPAQVAPNHACQVVAGNWAGCTLLEHAWRQSHDLVQKLLLMVFGAASVKDQLSLPHALWITYGHNVRPKLLEKDLSQLMAPVGCGDCHHSWVHCGTVQGQSGWAAKLEISQALSNIFLLWG